MEPQEEEEEDRFSNLHDSIAHQILSFLDWKELLQLSLASKRCRKFIFSLPVLKFVLNFSDRAAFSRFDRFIVRYFALREKEVPVSNFKLSVCFGDSESFIRNDVGFSLGTWMIFAANCKSRKIIFEAYLPDSDTFTLPLKVMQCSFLREMKINLIGGQLKVPWLDICSRIESLSLNCLCISTNDLKEWVISCKHLKKLNLFKLSNVNKLDLSSSSLKVLHIRHFIVNSLNISVQAEQLMFLDINLDKPHSLVIDAPKLLSLIWNGMATGYECVGGYLQAKPCVEISIFGTLKTWRKVFRSLRAVSELSLSNFPMELMSSKYSWEIFHNLNSLTVWMGDVDGLAPLLHLAPYLNRLEVKIRAASPTKHTAEYWESQVFAFVNLLESVRLDINGEQNGIELIKYLLRNARKLKTIIIHCSFDPKVISRSLRQFRWASPSARVYFN